MTAAGPAHAGPRSLQRLLDAVLLVGSDLELATVLRRIIEAAVELVDARYGALGVLDESGTHLAAFITVGIDDATHARIGELPKGEGILGALIHDARPLRLAHLSEHHDSVGLPSNHPTMTSFLGVPIRVRDTVFGNLYLTDKTTAEVFTDIDEELVTGLAVAAGVAIEHARLYEDAQRRRVLETAMREVAAAIGVAPTDEQRLAEIVAGARALVGADVAALVQPAGGEGLEVRATDGDADLSRTFVGRPEVERVVGEVIGSRVAQLHDEASSSLGSFIVTPLESGAVVRALVVGRTVDAAGLGRHELEAVEAFVAHAATALDLEHVRDDVHRLSRLQDQERIARDLHDTVIQDLFATGLSLQGAIPLVVNEAVGQRIETAIGQLDRTIGRIRAVVFGLELGAAVVQRGLRARILDTVRESGEVLGFEPRVSFAGSIDTVVSAAVADEVLATLNEALSNIARHARARRVWVDIDVSDRVLLSVIDDGIGIAADRHDGNGLRNMRLRAERLGGTFEVAGGPEGGTALTWRVPTEAS